MLSEWEKGYLAGLIDGEGCITIQKNSNCRTFKAIVTITQRDMPIIEWLYSRFPNHLMIDAVKRNKGFKTNNAYFRISFFNQNAVNVLRECVHYLSLKKKQALCAIYCDELAKTCKRDWTKKRMGKLPEDIIDLQHKLHLKIKSLNSPATTERGGSLTKEMRQSELTQMINRQSAIRREAPLNLN